MADKKIELRVIAPTMATDKSPYKFRKDVDMVIMRCKTGDMGILPGRVPCSVVLDAGVLRIFDESVGVQERHMAIMGGIAHVGDDIVTILSDSAQKPEEIDVEQVNAAIKDARRRYDETPDLNKKSELCNEIHRYQIRLDVAATK